MAEGKSLIALTKDILRLENELIESQGELNPNLEKELEITETNFPQKVDAYAAILDRLDATELWATQQMKAFKEVIERVKSSREGLNFRMNKAMDLLGKSELEGQYYVFKHTWGTGKVEIIDEDELDKHYQKVTYTPDKKRIGEDLKAGMVVHGAILIKERSVKKSIKR